MMKKNKLISKSVRLSLLTSLFMLPLWVGCSGVDDAPEHEKACVVSFTLPAIETRAATSLPVGATLRVVAYRRTTGQVGYPEANRRDECTYKVGTGGTLSLCAVKDDGTVDATGAPQTDMALAPGTYDFYAISPALRVYHDVANPMVAVKHGVDFASSMTAFTVGEANNNVAIASLNRQCAKLTFNTDRQPTLGSITKIRVQSLTLEEMSDQPAWATGISAVAWVNNTNSTSLTLPASAFSVPAGNADYQQRAETFCLPRPSKTFRLRASVLYNTDTTPNVLETTVDATALVAGKSYTFNISFGYKRIEVKMNNTWTDITQTEDHFGVLEDLNVVLGGTANCYVITDGAKAYRFDATKWGNSATGVAGINYGTLPDLGTATEARVIWQTGGTSSVIKSTYLQNGKVYFTTGTAMEGNAVIGIFPSSEATAPCLWSWHIWRLNGSAPGTVTASKTSATTGVAADVIMMDRNLGAYNNTPANVGSIGLFYQWGRKDPFPGPGVFSNTEPTNIYGSWNNGSGTGSWSGAYSVKTAATNATIGTEAWAVKYPTAFILQTSSPYDWMYTKNDYLWGTPWEAGGTGSYNKNQGTKSIYDPCPVGYRVPPQDTWSRQTGNGSFSNNGIILGSFHASLWFPAAGYRDGNSTGALAGAGYGYYWSSSVNSAGSTNGGLLYFVSNGGVIPRNGNSRAPGFSVRCVSE